MVQVAYLQILPSMPEKARAAVRLLERNDGCHGSLAIESGQKVGATQ
jgi:hypothetical protein